ncbi:MAG: hypothetical protein WC803_05010 [Sphingomonas sp.]
MIAEMRVEIAIPSRRRRTGSPSRVTAAFADFMVEGNDTAIL